MTPTASTPACSDSAHRWAPRALEPWDTVFFPRGTGGAHGVRNETEDTVRVLMFSEVVMPTATVYPDSDKVGVYTGNKDENLIVKRSSRVDYYEGES